MGVGLGVRSLSKNWENGKKRKDLEGVEIVWKKGREGTI